MDLWPARKYREYPGGSLKAAGFGDGRRGDSAFSQELYATKASEPLPHPLRQSDEP
jgi:hypothetical protein